LENAQTTLAQRLNFLLKHFNLSARKFSRAIGVPENNTQNYLGENATIPKADYLERVVLYYGSINAHWLLTGDGDPFVEVDEDGAAEPKLHYQKVKNNAGNLVGANHGTSTQTMGAAGNEEKLKSLEREVQLLNAQLHEKERYIQLLEKNQK
jgi:hypothetical protein